MRSQEAVVHAACDLQGRLPPLLRLTLPSTLVHFPPGLAGLRLKLEWLCWSALVSLREGCMPAGLSVEPARVGADARVCRAGAGLLCGWGMLRSCAGTQPGSTPHHACLHTVARLAPAPLQLRLRSEGSTWAELAAARARTQRAGGQPLAPRGGGVAVVGAQPAQPAAALEPAVQLQPAAVAAAASRGLGPATPPTGMHMWRRAGALHTAPAQRVLLLLLRALMHPG